MPCRVGITTNPDRRRSEWDARVVCLRKWQIVSEHWTKSGAQRAEAEYANKTGCEARAGGSGPEVGNWRVYRFNYVRKRKGR